MLATEQYMCQNGQCDSAHVYYKNEASLDKENIEGIYGDYDDNGYIFYVNPNDWDRTDFNQFLDGIRELSVNNEGCRVIAIDINMYHCLNKAIIKLSILFEFSTIGDNNIKFNTHV